MSHTLRLIGATAIALGIVGLICLPIWWIVRALTLPIVFGALAVIAFAILEGPALVGYHHCGLSDYLLSGPRLHGFKLLGTAWCKQ